MGSVLRYKIRRTIRQSERAVDMVTKVRRTKARASHNLKGTYYSLKFDAPIQPFRLIEIDPQSVTEIHDGSSKIDIKTSRGCSITGGDWDRKTKNIEKYTLYQSFRDRFCHGTDWEETELWQDVVENERWTSYHAASLEEFRERCQKLDKLHDRIDTYGYKTQSELETESDDPIRENRRTLPPEMYEVTVDIGRDGQLILATGRHRLTMTHVMGLDDIPVRVRTRHTQWQRKRDQVYTGERTDADHPDLAYLKPTK